MPWFQCDDCGDSLKKPKLAGHMRQCRASRFTCIDCGVTFDRNSVQGHTSCVTEHEKYAQAATKPGGRAYGSGAEAAAGMQTSSGTVLPGHDPFLSTRAPWKCSSCNVNCTSEETLQGHAQGKKHRNKLKAHHAQQAKDAAAASAPPAEEAAATDKKGKAKATEAPETTKRKAEDEVGAANNKEAKAIKWKKIITEELKAAEGKSLALKKLKKALLKRVAGTVAAAGRSEDALTKELMERLEGSSKFAVKDKTVTLAKDD